MINKSRFLIIFLIFFVFLLLFGVYKLATFSIFDNNIEIIEQIKIPNKKYILNIYYIPSNASSQSYIQVRKSENNFEEVLKNFERYNTLEKYMIMDNDTLMLLLSDNNLKKKPEEVKMRLP